MDEGGKWIWPISVQGFITTKWEKGEAAWMLHESTASARCDGNKTWWHSSLISKGILHNTIKSSTILTFCRECHDLLMKYIFSLFVVIHREREQLGHKRKWSTSGNNAAVSDRAIPSPLFQEDNKRRQAKLRVKSKVNCSQENVNQFYRSPTRDMQPLVEKMLEYL